MNALEKLSNVIQSKIGECYVWPMAKNKKFEYNKKFSQNTILNNKIV